jgi:hypothetical protein
MMIFLIWSMVVLLAANLPFSLGRRFSMKLRLSAFLIGYALSMVYADILEKKMYLNVHEQSWPFYVVTFILFIVMAIPSITWRYFWTKV